MPDFVLTRVSNRLKEFVNGFISDEEESLPEELWGFEIQPDLWDLEIPKVLAMAV